jgi:protease I
MVSKKVLYIIAQQNFRDEEYLIPKKILEDNGIKVITASITRDECIGSIKARVKPDIAVSEANPNQYDMLIIAGGSGSPKLADYPEVLDLIRRFDYLKKPIAAICAAGYVLAKAGILTNVRATVFPSDFAIAEYKRRGVKYSSEALVVDGRIITASGPDQAENFGKEIVKLLSSF